MRLYYHRDVLGNFGDDLNAWLWPRVAPELLEDDGSELLVGIGTVLNETVPSGPRKWVFGSGAGYGAPPRIDARWRLYAVRGPITARLLGLPPSMSVTDGAALIARTGINATHTGAAIFVPHHISQLRAAAIGLDLRAAATSVGLEYCDPSAGVESVLEQIRSSQLVVAEAMHAAIVADTLRVPWVAVRLFEHVDQLKWEDWSASIGQRHAPVTAEQAPSQRSVEGALQHAARRSGTLSSDSRFRMVVDELETRLQKLRSDAAALGVVQTVHRVEIPPLVAVGHDLDAGRAWWMGSLAAVATIDRLVPREQRYALVDGHTWRGSLVDASRTIALCDGAPATETEAVIALDVAASLGIRHVVVGFPAFWWLDTYPAFARRLQQLADVLHADDNVKVFRLRDVSPR